MMKRRVRYTPLPDSEDEGGVFFLPTVDAREAVENHPDQYEYADRAAVQYKNGDGMGFDDGAVDEESDPNVTPPKSRKEVKAMIARKEQQQAARNPRAKNKRRAKQTAENAPSTVRRVMPDTEPLGRGRDPNILPPSGVTSPQGETPEPVDLPT